MQVCARDFHIKEVGTGIGVIDVHELLYDKGGTYQFVYMV